MGIHTVALHFFVYILLTQSTKSSRNGMIKVFRFPWGDIGEVARRIIPPLSFQVHKGSMGRIGIVGGSPEYTGAPFYAGQSALKFGADLAYVFCAEQAVIPIKSYSPELMVTSFYDVHRVTFGNTSQILAASRLITDLFPRLHILIIGPGLGRSPFVIDAVSHTIREAIAKSVPLVIDADGLWLVSQNLSLIRGYTNCILTPNKVEFDRLVSTALAELTDGVAGEYHETEEMRILVEELASDCDIRKINALSKSLGGVTILKKGQDDMISCGEDVYMIQEIGSPRRCGGQGDVLAGSLGVALHWALNMNKEDNFDGINIPLTLPVELVAYASVSESPCHSSSSEIEKQVSSTKDPLESCHSSSTSGRLSSDIGDDSKFITSTENYSSSMLAPPRLVLAAILASVAVKKASSAAFKTKKRSMTTPDVIDCLGEAFESLL